MEQFLLPSTLGGSDSAEEAIVLDLGCGNGRDTVHMAQHLPPGTRVIGVDNHSYALERGERLAEQWVDAPDGGGTAGARLPDGSELDGGESFRDGPSDRHGLLNRGSAPARKCEWLLADLRKEGSLNGLKASVVHGHRFKCEQLLPLLRDDVSYIHTWRFTCVAQRLDAHLVRVSKFVGWRHSCPLPDSRHGTPYTKKSILSLKAKNRPSTNVFARERHEVPCSSYVQPQV